MTEVVAALIRQGDRFLICQMTENKARGLLWEFPGGKVEKGETKEEALIRECGEELGVKIGVTGVFTDVTHRYPDIDIHLTLFDSYIESGEITLLEHNDSRWITPAQTDEFEFCPADTDIIKKIKLEL